MCVCIRSHPRFYVCLYENENPKFLKYFTSVSSANIELAMSRSGNVRNENDTEVVEILYILYTVCLNCKSYV